MNIGIVVFDGFTDLDFYLPWDILNRVRLLDLAPKWKVEILGSNEKCISAAGLKLEITKPYTFANECEGVLFCSGPKTRELIEDRKFLASFQLDPDRQSIAAIDSGSLILGAIGLLRGKRATTYPTAFKLLEDLGAIPTREAFVVDGVATASRCLSGDKLALWIIERLTNKIVADQIFETIKPLQ